MKRKRGSKAGYKKGKKNLKSKGNDPVPVRVPTNTEEVLCSDDAADSQPPSETDVDHQVSLGSGSRGHVVKNVDGDPPTDTSKAKTSHGWVKVKLKPSRALEPHQSGSDAQTPSDTDKSNQQVGQEILDTPVQQKEDTPYSDGQTSEVLKNMVGKLPKKAGSIKIKSSRASGLPSETVHHKEINKVNTVKNPKDRSLEVKTTNESMPRNLRQRITRELYLDPRYNEKELNAALMVIKKVMKMEAAGPFNVPVDPVALGIPDYFDIIDTPMDFGTIRNDLEQRRKYLSSEDVYKDVQYIWENCYKYNNKGDYIVDLMKRVKKNFMKYWMEAGLYSGVPSSSAAESNPSSGPGKLPAKGKPKHKRKRVGIDLHKSDCLCAVCVMRRRRKEKQEGSVAAGSQIATPDVSLSRDHKPQEGYPISNHCPENASPSLDHSMGIDANADMEEADTEDRMEYQEQFEHSQQEDAIQNELDFRRNASSSNESSEQLSLENGTQYSEQQSQEPEGELRQLSELRDNIIVQQEGGAHLGESYGRSHQFRIQEQHFQENHSILQICSNLFSSDPKSVWNGPHSLSRRRLPTVRDNPIHAAITAFLRQ